MIPSSSSSPTSLCKSKSSAVRPFSFSLLILGFRINPSVVSVMAHLLSQIWLTISLSYGTLIVSVMAHFLIVGVSNVLCR